MKHSRPPATRVRRSGILPIVIVLAGSFVSAGLAAVANWIAANGLGAAGFGLFSLAMAIMTVLQEVGGPALDTAIVRFAGPLTAKDPQRAEIFFRAGLRIKILVSGTLAISLFAAADYLAVSVFEEPTLATLIRWMALTLLAVNISTITLTRLQSSERFVAYAVLRIFSNGVKVALLTGTLIVGWLTPQSATIVWTISFVLTYLVGMLICRQWHIVARPMPDDRPHSDIAHFAVWVMLSGLLFAVHIRTDILLLGHFGTAEEVGNYAIAWNMMLLMDIITSSLVIALLPRAARAKSATEVANLRKGALLIGLGVTVLLLPLNFFAEFIFGVLFPDFPNAVAPFRLLFWSSIIVLLIYPLYLGFYAQNRPGKVTTAYGLLAVSSIVIGLQLIPSHGLMGAAATTLIARVVGAVAILSMLALERPILAKG